MKILLVNKFLYPRGGDCIHTLNLGRMLREAGHTVRFYTMDYPENIQDEGKPFFAKEINFSSTSLSGKIKAAKRILWGTGVKESFKELLKDFQPDIVHLNNIHSYLSPLVARLAHEQGIRLSGHYMIISCYARHIIVYAKEKYAKPVSSIKRM